MKFTRKPKILPKPVAPNSAERDYLRYINKYVKLYIDLMRTGLEEIIPDLKETAGKEMPQVRMDANVESRVRKLFDKIQAQLDDSFSDAMLRRWAKNMVGNVNRNSKKNTTRAIKAGYKKTGEVPNFEPLMQDGKLSPYFENVVDENVGLIRSIPLHRLEPFKNQLVAVITKDRSYSEIKKIIIKHFGATRARAALIARDQVGKLNGQLNKYRQQQLGAKRYIWRSSADARERKDHRRLNNTVQLWSRPPIVNRSTGERGHPADDYQCRCWAEMVLEDILE